MFAVRPRPGRGRAVAAAVVALVATSVTAPAAATEPPAELPLALTVTKDRAEPYQAGDTVTFTYTATNTSGAAITAAPGESVDIHFQTDPDKYLDWYDGVAEMPVQLGGACDFSGTAPDLLTLQATALLPETFEAGATIECTLTYTTTPADVVLGGLWTALTHSPGGGFEGRWDYSTFLTYATAGGSDLPTVTGTPVVGGTLTAPTWWCHPYAAPHERQWQRDGVAIDGATGPTYTLTPADVGAAITLQVAAPEVGTAWTSLPTAAVAPATLTPATPTIAGTAKVGQRLTAKRGTWLPAGVTFRYQWLRNGTAITGATSYTYALAAADKTARISVKVTGSLPGYTTASATSAQTAAVAAGTITVTKRTSITGTPRVGRTLTVVRPAVDVTGATYTQQWLRNGKAVTGATGTKYTLTSRDKGTRISVKVTVKKPGYLATSSTSPATAVVTS